MNLSSHSLEIIITRSQKSTPIAVFCSLIAMDGRSNTTFASRRVLLAVIFSSENAPDSQTGHGAGISQNIRAVFSRIRAILGVGNPSREDGLRRRRGAGKRVGFQPVLWGITDPKTGLFFPFLLLQPISLNRRLSHEAVRPQTRHNRPGRPCPDGSGLTPRSFFIPAR